MSDLAPEAPPKPKGLEATLTKKVIGPVPLWLVIGIGGGVLLLLLHRGSGAGGSSGAAATGDTGAVDSASGDPGATAGGVGSLDGGPTGNVGGFEDPGVGSDPGFVWPDDSGGSDPSPSPPASDPVYDPSAGMVPMVGGWYSPGMLSPDWQAQVVAMYSGYKPPSNTPVKPPRAVQSKPGTSQGGFTVVSSGADKSPRSFAGLNSSALQTIVHNFSSPAGRIAAVTTPFSVGGSSTFVHASSVAAHSGSRVMAE